jgi:hypothetical protein
MVYLSKQIDFFKDRKKTIQTAADVEFYRRAIEPIGNLPIPIKVQVD